MAYSPVDQGRVGGQQVLRDIATRHGVTSVEIALAWVLHHEAVVAVPRTGAPAQPPRLV